MELKKQKTYLQQKHNKVNLSTSQHIVSFFFLWDINNRNVGGKEHECHIILWDNSSGKEPTAIISTKISKVSCM